MKALKITLLLAVFVVSFSGSNTEIESENNLPTVDKQEFKLYVLDTGKKKKPGQNI